MNLFEQDFVVHSRESNPESQSYLEAGREQFSNNCKLLFQKFMNGEVINSNTSPVGDFRRRLCDLKENGVNISFTTNGRIKDWYMSESDKEFNKKFC